MLALTSVGHTYRRGPQALKAIDLEVGPGVTALVGANGAGKSTLMKIACGALRPASGEVSVEGFRLYVRRERSRALSQVAWMPQAAGFPRSLTASEFVRYVTWLRGVPAAEAETRALEALRSVDLGQVMQTKMSRLSGGMVRRVWLAQALAAQAEVLLLDEPSTGLDPRQRATMVELLRRHRHGSVLLSSHILEDVADLADRVVVLDHGEVVYNGPRPETLDGQWFLGLTRDGR